MSEAPKQKREELTRKILAEVDALVIDNDTLAAVQKLNDEEAQLERRLLNREITEDEHYDLWRALTKQTPRDDR